MSSPSSTNTLRIVYICLFSLGDSLARLDDAPIARRPYTPSSCDPIRSFRRDRLPRDVCSKVSSWGARACCRPLVEESVVMLIAYAFLLSRLSHSCIVLPNVSVHDCVAVSFNVCPEAHPAPHHRRLVAPVHPLTDDLVVTNGLPLIPKRRSNRSPPYLLFGHRSFRKL